MNIFDVLQLVALLINLAVIPAARTLWKIERRVYRIETKLGIEDSPL